jgi:hypothetical protein
VVVADQARSIGARDVVLHLIDYEQGALVPVPGDAVGCGAPLSVAGTVAGRAFSSTSIVHFKGDVPGLQRLYLPRAARRHRARERERDVVRGRRALGADCRRVRALWIWWRS